MATVGSLVINLALNTAGITSGLAGVEAQLKAFDAQMSGANSAAAAEAAGKIVASAQNAVTIATARANVAQLALQRVQLSTTASAEQLAAAELRATSATIALADAQVALADAEKLAANPSALMAKTNQFPLITAGAALASLAILKFGDDGVKAASQFQYTMELLATQTNVNREFLNSYSEAILKMAPAAQQGPEELAKGLYHITSVGYRGAEAMNILMTAAQGAAIGNANLESVTNALVAALTTGITRGKSFTEVMGILNATVGVGNLRMEDLTSSLSSGVLSTAKQFGLSLEDVGSALAAMADQGIPAEEAATRLRITIALLGAPTKIATAELNKIGLTQRAIADAMRGPEGLVGALKLLKEHLVSSGLDAVEQSQVLKNAFGGSRSSAGILTLLNSLQLLETKKKQIEEGAGTFGEKFLEESQLAEAGFRRLRATVDVLSIRIGNALMPVISVIANALVVLGSNAGLVTGAFLSLTAIFSLWAAISVGKFIAGMLNTIKTFVLARIEAYNLLVASKALSAAQLEAAATQQAASAATAASAMETTNWARAEAEATAVAAQAVGVQGELAGAVASSVAPTAELAGAQATAAQSVAEMSGNIGAFIPVLGGYQEAMTGAFGATLEEAAANAELAMSLGAVSEGVAAVGAEQMTLMEASAGAATAFSEEALAADAAATALSNMTIAQARSAEAAAVASAAAEAETVALTGATGAGLGLTAMLSALALPITIFAAAIMLLVTNFERVKQGLRLLVLGFISALKVILDLASQVPFIGDQFKGLANGLADAQTAMKNQMRVAETEMAAGAGDIANDVSLQISEGMAKGIIGGSDSVKGATQSMVQAYGVGLGGVSAASLLEGATAMDELAKGIIDNQNAPVVAMKAALDAVKTTMTDGAQIAQLVGQLMSKEMLDGLNSDKSGVVAATAAWQKHVIQQLDMLTDGAYSAGTRTGMSWQEGLSEQLQRAGFSTAEIQSQISQILADPEKLKTAQKNWADLGEEWRRMAPSAATADGAYKKLLNDVNAGLSSGSGQSIADQAAAIVDKVGISLRRLRSLGKNAGGDTMLEVAKGIREKQDAPLNALKDLHNMLKNQFNRNREIALLWGELQSKDLARGMASGDPAVLAQAIATKKLIEDRLDELTGGAYTRSLQAGANIGKGLNDAKPVVSAGMVNAISSVGPVLRAAQQYAGTASRAAGHNIGVGLNNSSGDVSKGISHAVNPIGLIMGVVQKFAGTSSRNAGHNIGAGLLSQRGGIAGAAANAVLPIFNVLRTLIQFAFSAGRQAGAAVVAGYDAAKSFGEARENNAATSAHTTVARVLTFAQILQAALRGAGSQAGFLNTQLSALDKTSKSLGNSLGNTASGIKSQMSSAFDAIKAKAHAFFDAMHNKNLKAIQDAHDLKNSLIDAKEALNQKPVTAAQKALDFQRKAQEEWRLRKAVQEATDPESRRDAVLALQDFLAQKNIDMMQDEVDAANAKLEEEKKNNDAIAAEQTKAENQRYAAQKKAFDAELKQLEAYLKRHPAAWRKVQNEINALLRSFGVSYHAAGALLGNAFVKGLKSAVHAAALAAAALARAGTPGGSSSGTTNHAIGAWNIPTDEVANIHAREMVVPPNVSDDIRRIVGGRGFTSLPYLLQLGVGAERKHAMQARINGIPDRRPLSLPELRTFVQAPKPNVGNHYGWGNEVRGNGGGGTIIVMIGNEKIAEVTDRGLYVQETIYGAPRRIAGSVR